MMIRKAQIQDLEKIVEIYNQAITAGFQTADTDVLSVADRLEWFALHEADQYPLFVAEIEDVVVGWLSISPYRPGRKALNDCGEISFYIDHSWRRKGIASLLIEAAIDACKALHYYSLFAIVIDKNEASIKLLERFGFTRWAHLPDIVNYSGQRCGQVYYGIHLV